MTVATARAHLEHAERVLAEAQQARDRAADLLDESLAVVGWRGLVAREALDRARSSRSDLRDSRSALDAVPGPGGAAARAFRKRGRPAGDDGMTSQTRST